MQDKVRIYTDGAARGNPGPAATGFMIRDEAGRILDKDAKFIEKATNNEAEYKALIAALKAATSLTKGEVTCFSDSKLLVSQLKGEYRVKARNLEPLVTEVRKLRQAFRNVDFVLVPRENEGIAAVDEMINKELEKRGFPKRNPFAGRRQS